MIHDNNNEPIEDIGVKSLQCSESCINLLYLGVNLAINHRDTSKKVNYIKIDYETRLIHLGQLVTSINVAFNLK